VQKLHCKRCNNIWTYKGANPYCANCSRCKSTVFIKKASLSAEKRDLRSSGGGLDGNRREKIIAQQQKGTSKTDSGFPIKE
jgi:hypothetical protein